jgi:hypothetical protein
VVFVDIAAELEFQKARLESINRSILARDKNAHIDSYSQSSNSATYKSDAALQAARAKILSNINRLNKALQSGTPDSPITQSWGIK